MKKIKYKPKLNWKARFSNPVFVAQIVGAIVLPILAEHGIEASDVTSWISLFNLVMDTLANPYLLAIITLNIYSALTDPTSKGFKDSEQTLNYLTAKKKGGK